MDTEKRKEQKRQAAARIREKRHAIGLREVIVWATPSQAEIIKKVAAQKSPDPITDLSPQEAGQDDMRWSWAYAARLLGVQREEPTEQEICEAVRYLYRQGRGVAEIGALFIQWG
jgi:hypothetical protein